MNCIRIENSLANTYYSNSDELSSTHLKSSLNYQFYSGQLSINSQNTQPVVIRAIKLTTDNQNVNLFAEQASQLTALNHENVINDGVAIGIIITVQFLNILLFLNNIHL